MPRDDPHRRTRARVRGMTYLMLDITYNFSLRRSRTSCVNPAPRLRLCGFALQKVNRSSSLVTVRGGNDADFDRQAPRIAANLGRHRSLNDDRHGPAGKPPEDASSGEPEGRDLAFVCEPMSYAVDMSDEEFGRKKADTIIRTAEVLSPLGFDVLKAEFPGDPKVTPDSQELRKNCERLSRATKVPWVVLSAGADFDVFRGLVELA